MLNGSFNFVLNLDTCEWNIQAKFPKKLDGKDSDSVCIFFLEIKTKSPMEMATFWFRGKTKTQFVTLRKHQQHLR
jgi:hypothetical protein